MRNSYRKENRIQKSSQNWQIYAEKTQFSSLKIPFFFKNIIFQTLVDKKNDLKGFKTAAKGILNKNRNLHSRMTNIFPKEFSKKSSKIEKEKTKSAQNRKTRNLKKLGRKEK